MQRCPRIIAGYECKVNDTCKDEFHGTADALYQMWVAYVAEYDKVTQPNVPATSPIAVFERSDTRPGQSRYAGGRQTNSMFLLPPQQIE